MLDLISRTICGAGARSRFRAASDPMERSRTGTISRHATVRTGVQHLRPALLARVPEMSLKEDALKAHSRNGHKPVAVEEPEEVPAEVLETLHDSRPTFPEHIAASRVLHDDGTTSVAK